MTLPPKKTPMEEAWDRRKKLYIKASTLFSEGQKLLHANKSSVFGWKYLCESNILRNRGDIEFYDAVIATYGENTKVDWNAYGELPTGSATVEGIFYTGYYPPIEE